MERAGRQRKREQQNDLNEGTEKHGGLHLQQCIHGQNHFAIHCFMIALRLFSTPRIAPPVSPYFRMNPSLALLGMAGILHSLPCLETAPCAAVASTVVLQCLQD